MVCLISMFSIQDISAQQPPQYTQYMFNTAVLNPGYTGVGGKIEGNLLYRSQWVGIEGAPENQSFSLHAKANDRIGLGITATNDKLGASNNVNLNGNFAYEITTGYKTKLSLGLNAGLDILQVDWSKGTFANQQDPLFRENINQTRPIFGAAARPHHAQGSGFRNASGRHRFDARRCLGPDRTERQDQLHPPAARQHRQRPT